MDQPSPKFTSIDSWGDMSGMGRRKIYEEIARGNLVAVKLSRRTLIDTEAGFRYLSSLPPAVIRMQVRRKNAT